MSMTPEYEHLYQEAKELEHRTHDSTDDHEASDARNLEHQIIGLQDDLRAGRNPRDIESRIKQIQSTLEIARHQTGAYMSVSDADRYWHVFEDMHLNLRKLPNY